MRTEIVKAYVVLKPEFTASDELRDALKKYVKSVWPNTPIPVKLVLDELPMTVTGKVIRKKLRVRARAENEPNNEAEIQYLFGLRKFSSNQDANLAALDEVRAAAELAQLGGGAKSRDRHVARGKMLPRDRVANLLDHGSAFLEVGATGAWPLRWGGPRCGDDCGHRYSFRCDLHDPVQ